MAANIRPITDPVNPLSGQIPTFSGMAFGGLYGGPDAATATRSPGSGPHDGDSFVAELEGGSEADVRMIGVNAPEFGECLYREAKAALTGLVGEGTVGLERDVTDRDRYRRMLRYVHAGGVLANIELVERGLALTVFSSTR